MTGIKRTRDMLERYFKRNQSSLAFWWLPLFEGDNYLSLSSNQACDYYLDFTAKAQYDMLFDSNGVIMLDYLGALGVQYNPCAVAQYGLGLFARYLRSRDDDDLRRAIVQGDWLCSELVTDEMGMGRWEYTFRAYNAYEADMSFFPYISSIAQGQGISLLLRLYAHTGEQRYLSASRAAFVSFIRPIEQRGVAHRDEHGHVFLEEAPTSHVSCILDGYMYAIFGVYDYALVSLDDAAQQLFVDCIDTLEDILPQFELGYWSRADLFIQKPKMPASPFYHNVHICQLRALHKITGRDVFLETADRWDRYQHSIWCKGRAILAKIFFKLFHY